MILITHYDHMSFSPSLWRVWKGWLTITLTYHSQPIQSLHPKSNPILRKGTLSESPSNQSAVMFESPSEKGTFLRTWFERDSNMIRTKPLFSASPFHFFYDFTYWRKRNPIPIFAKKQWNWKYGSGNKSQSAAIQDSTRQYPTSHCFTAFYALYSYQKSCCSRDLAIFIKII